MMRAVRRILVAALLAACAVSAVLAVSLPARGRTLVTWTAPHGRPAGVVLVVHGGAWRAAGARTVALMDARARTFAGWGWAAAVVDYRAFADAPGDVVRAYDAARERYPGLPICAYGESAGRPSGAHARGAPPAGLRDRRRRAGRPAAPGRHAAGRLGARQGARRLRRPARRLAHPPRGARSARPCWRATRPPTGSSRPARGATSSARCPAPASSSSARGAGPRFVHATVPGAALRGWWSAVRAAASARRVAAQVVGVGHRAPARRLDLEQLERAVLADARRGARRGRCRRRARRRAPMCGCSARTTRALTSAGAAGSSVRSAAVIFSA